MNTPTDSVWSFDHPALSAAPLAANNHHQHLKKMRRSRRVRIITNTFARCNSTTSNQPRQCTTRADPHEPQPPSLAVDTHDAFSRSNYSPPDDHPDAAAWRNLQEKNATLKARIEEALEGAGYLTFKSLLRMGLPADPTVVPTATV